MIYLFLLELLRTNEYDLDKLRLVLYVLLSIHIILLILFQFLFFFSNKIPSFYTLVRILYDIYKFTFNVINYLRLALCIPPLLFFAIGKLQHYFGKGGHSFKDLSLKLHLTPRLSGGFLYTKYKKGCFILY